MRGLIFLSLFIVHFHSLHAQTGMHELGDSLTVWTGFSRVWSPDVRVKQMRVNGTNVTLRTNATLKDVRWTPEKIAEIKQKVSQWVLGNNKGKVTIIAGKTNIETLITDCAGGGRTANSNGPDLTDRQIALWPSHGLYFHRERNEWIWQRATLWTTVEDLYSQEYVRLIRQMLENAGATVVMPRAGLEQTDLGRSGMPRWTEGARYWLEHQGADSTLWDLYEGDEYKDDMKCRTMWVNALSTPVDVCLALHTDGLDSGDDSTIVGTLAIYTARDDDGRLTLANGKDREKTNRNLADWIQTQVTEDLRHIAPEWTRRQLKEANYCESRVPTVPCVLLELLSHKNMADMRYGLHPAFRFAAARAVYKGLLRFLNGPDAIVQPLPVQEVGIDVNGLLQWLPQNDSIEPTAAPTYYMVYVQADDGEWEVQQVEHDTYLQLDLKPGVRYNCYVVAGNEGGLSFPGPTVSACLTSNSQAVLIVDAFDEVYGPDWFADSTYAGIVPGSYACEDRFSCAYVGEQWDYTRAHPWLNDDNCGWGACYRDHAGQLTVGNTRDYTALHGRVLQQMNISYVSCTAGMLSDSLYPTSRFLLADFICGRNKTPLTADSRQFISDHLNHGGRVLLSTDHFSAIAPQWAKQYLHASYYAAHATRSGHVRVSGHKPFHVLMQPNERQLFTCTPEGLKAEKDAMPWARYDDMRCPAAINAPSSLVFGFPLESVTDFERLYRLSVEALIR